MVELTDDYGKVMVNMSQVVSISEFSGGTLLTFKDYPDIVVKETIHEIAMKAKHND